MGSNPADTNVALSAHLVLSDTGMIRRPSTKCELIYLHHSTDQDYAKLRLFKVENRIGGRRNSENRIEPNARQDPLLCFDQTELQSVCAQSVRE